MTDKAFVAHWATVQPAEGEDCLLVEPAEMLRLCQIAARGVESGPRRCTLCGYRWEGQSGAEHCGDCHRAWFDLKTAHAREVETLKANKDRIAERCAMQYANLIEPLRAVCIGKGYALGVHGSLERDIDLIAVPWRDDCVSPQDLADELVAVTKKVNGYAKITNDKVDDPWDRRNRPEPKPHGRIGWCIHLGGGPYLDLSVMPPVPRDYAPVEHANLRADEAEARYIKACDKILEHHQRAEAAEARATTAERDLAELLQRGYGRANGR